MTSPTTTAQELAYYGALGTEVEGQVERGGLIVTGELVTAHPDETQIRDADGVTWDVQPGTLIDHETGEPVPADAR